MRQARKLVNDHFAIHGHIPGEDDLVAAIAAALGDVQAAPARDDLAEWKQAASVEAGLRREFLARAERLRLELEKIAWMDEFLDAHGAKVMMQIARDAVNEDERCSTGSEPSKQDFGPWTSPGREGGHFKPDEKMK